MVAEGTGDNCVASGGWSLTVEVITRKRWGLSPKGNLITGKRRVVLDGIGYYLLASGLVAEGKGDHCAASGWSMKGQGIIGKRHCDPGQETGSQGSVGMVAEEKGGHMVAS
ncbi:hypothetical protein DPMN_145818 [Dreissena polymorpha]|uniref:Uncharacterized protein n=1 Tax=Dreissena polymorpha TaxID=45954 RepID=A0A9D4F4S3_DREPO|nr:hypothetical protein DPMN_145818 [Dreissena polymorpha]